MEKGFCDGPEQTLRRWQNFDTRLRNELAKIRASRKHIDPLKYLRRYEYTDLHLAHLATQIQRNPSIIEAQRMLDGERWHYLDEFSQGHYFDINVLIVYALKLLLLERWDKIHNADKTAALEEVLTKNMN